MMISGTKYTKNVLVGSFAVLVRDEIHCNKYLGTRRVTSIGYPGSKISTRFNPSKVGVRSTVVERATYMLVFAGSSPTSADHRKELI